MLYANQKDIERCKIIVIDELSKQNIKLEDDVVDKITVDIMNISYSKGGDYSNKIIRRFAEVYINRGFYKEFIVDKENK